MTRESENSSVGGKSGSRVFALLRFVEICHHCNARGARNLGTAIEVLKWIFVYIFFHIRHSNSDHSKPRRRISLVHWSVYMHIYTVRIWPIQHSKSYYRNMMVIKLKKNFWNSVKYFAVSYLYLKAFFSLSPYKSKAKRILF